MRTWYEAATLCLDVYSDPSDTDHDLPPGWKLLLPCPPELQKDGYYGAVYVKESPDGKSADVMIASRGTESWESLGEDILFFLEQKAPAEFKDSVIPFTEAALKKLDQQYPNGYKVTFAGHSLGSVLAEMSVAKWCDHASQPECITFESPGSQPFIQTMITNKTAPAHALDYANQHVYTANADVDAINSVFPHVGRNRLCYVGYDYVASFLGGYPEIPNPAYFFFDFTIYDQHSMTKLAKYWANSDRQYLIPTVIGTNPASDWPSDVYTAYNYYMNYQPHGQMHHRAYWEHYLMLCWNTHADLRQKYNDDPTAFSEFFIEKMLRHDLAQSPVSAGATAALPVTPGEIELQAVTPGDTSATVVKTEKARLFGKKTKSVTTPRADNDHRVREFLKSLCCCAPFLNRR